MAAMETLVDIVMGASLCGLHQKTLSHVLFPEISDEREMGGGTSERLLDPVKLQYEMEDV